MTHYERLGVKRTADRDEIRAAYLDLVREHHPDHKSDGSREVIQEINEAWRILGNENRRRVYDEEIGGSARPTYALESLSRQPMPRAEPFEDAEGLILLFRRAIIVLAIVAASAIVIASAVASGGESPTQTTVPRPNIGEGIAGGDCVDIAEGPSLIERSCSATADGRVVAAFEGQGSCPSDDHRAVQLKNGVVVCLDDVVGSTSTS